MRSAVNDPRRVVGEHRSAVPQQEAAGAAADRRYHRRAMTAHVDEAVRLSDAGAAPTGPGEGGATYVFELRTGLEPNLREASCIVGLQMAQLRDIGTPRAPGWLDAHAAVRTSYLDWFIRRQRRLARVRQVSIDVGPETAERRALELAPSARGRAHSQAVDAPVRTQAFLRRASCRLRCLLARQTPAAGRSAGS